MPEKKEKKMIGKDLSDEKYRAYTVYVSGEGLLHEIIIEKPKLLFWKPGHSFHRIYDGIKVHLAPAPGILKDNKGEVVGYVEMYWQPIKGKDPVAF